MIYAVQFPPPSLAPPLGLGDSELVWWLQTLQLPRLSRACYSALKHACYRPFLFAPAGLFSPLWHSSHAPVMGQQGPPCHILRHGAPFPPPMAA